MKNRKSTKTKYNQQIAIQIETNSIYGGIIMRVFVVYCHPSEKSFTYDVYDNFVRGLKDAGHEILFSDLYKMDFKTDISEEEYWKETFYRVDIPVAGDVRIEQEKIQSSDAIVFIYPVFWTEAPAKLVGWFDRVWTAGFAYEPNPQMKILDKALVIACAGNSLKSLAEAGEKDAMETVMLGDRLHYRVKQKEMVIFDNITHWNEELRERTAPLHLSEAYKLGFNF